jgi:hypothetical protein
LKEMKSMQKQAQQPTKGKEEKGPLVQIKLGSGKPGGSTGGDAGEVKKGGFKKGGFKSAFGSAEDEEPVELKKDDSVDLIGTKGDVAPDEDSDVTDQEDYYDPRQPTGCMPGCNSKVRAVAG